MRKTGNNPTGEYNIAIVLAAGRGTRMGTDLPKQYLILNGIPVLAHSLLAFERCADIHAIWLVTGADDIGRCRTIVQDHEITKAAAVIAGGEQRYDSVYAALRDIRDAEDRGKKCSFVLIHDGARPLIDQEIIRRNLDLAREKGCAITGMPVKDTIKICREDGCVEQTPNRSLTWLVQTPQTFRYQEILEAYDKLFTCDDQGGCPITDDAMVMERFGSRPVYMCEGDYSNLKITTPEDLKLAGQLFWTQKILP